jgi:hypothetical protein
LLLALALEPDADQSVEAPGQFGLGEGDEEIALAAGFGAEERRRRPGVAAAALALLLGAGGGAAELGQARRDGAAQPEHLGPQLATAGPPLQLGALRLRHRRQRPTQGGRVVAGRRADAERVPQGPQGVDLEPRPAQHRRQVGRRPVPQPAP